MSENTSISAIRGLTPSVKWIPRPDVVRANPTLEDMWMRTNAEIEDILTRVSGQGRN